MSELILTKPSVALKRTLWPANFVEVLMTGWTSQFTPAVDVNPATGNWKPDHAMPKPRH